MNKNMVQDIQFNVCMVQGILSAFIVPGINNFGAQRKGQ